MLHSLLRPILTVALVRIDASPSRSLAALIPFALAAASET